MWSTHSIIKCVRARTYLNYPQYVIHYADFTYVLVLGTFHPWITNTKTNPRIRQQPLPPHNRSMRMHADGNPPIHTYCTAKLSASTPTVFLLFMVFAMDDILFGSVAWWWHMSRKLRKIDHMFSSKSDYIYVRIEFRIDWGCLIFNRSTQSCVGVCDVNSTIDRANVATYILSLPMPHSHCYYMLRWWRWQLLLMLSCWKLLAIKFRFQSLNSVECVLRVYILVFLLSSCMRRRWRIQGAISIYENWDCLLKDCFELISHKWINSRWQKNEWSLQ